MRKPQFSIRKATAICALAALVMGVLVLTPITAYAESENMGFSDSLTVKLISPESSESYVIPIVIGVGIGVIAIGLVILSRANRGKSRRKHSS